MRRAVPLLWLLALASCDDGANARPDPCAARITTMEARLSALAAAADPEDAPPDVALPEVDAGAAVGPIPLLVVGVGEVRFDGRGVGGLEGGGTAATLARDLRVAAGVPGAPEPFVVGLWADPELEVGALVPLLRAAPPSVHFALLARGPAIPGPEAPTWVTEALARVEPPPVGEGVMPGISAVSPAAQRRLRIAESWPRATESCPAARDGLSFAPERGTLRRAPSVSTIVGAVRACGCATADVAAIDALATEAIRGDEGPLVRLPPPLRFGPATGDAAELAAEASWTVADLAGRLGGRSPETVVYVRAD